MGVLLLVAGCIFVPFALIAFVYFVLHPRTAVTVLLVLMPFHTLVFQILTVEFGLPPTLSLVMQMWREALLVCLAIYLVLRLLQGTKIRMAHPEVILAAIAYMLFGTLALSHSVDLTSGLYGYRGTFEPFVFLILILCLPLTLEWLQSLTPKLIVVGAVTACFAIFQSLVLGFEFVWKYYARDGALASSFSFMGGTFQRAMGTFASPNQLSLYIVFIFLLALNVFLRAKSRKSQWLLGTTMMLFLIALILTVSRSGWLALIAGITFSFVIWKRRRNFVIAAVIGLALAVPIFYALGLDQHLLNTVQGNEISANYRTGLAISNLQTAAQNPFGVGFGVVGARATRFSSDAQLYTTESYLLQMAMEIGFPGLLLFLALVCWCFIAIYRHTFTVTQSFLRAWGVTALAVIIAALTHAVFIPDLQDLTVGMYFWFFVGIGLKLLQIQASTTVNLTVVKGKR